MPDRIDAFLFDIGNVLLAWDPERLMRELVADEAEFHDFRDTVMNDARLLENDRGRDWDDILAEIASEAPHHANAARAFRTRWLETITGPIEANVRLLHRLRAEGFPVYALSNFGVENFAKTEAVYPFLREFDGRVISGHEGMVKPEPEIYAHTIERFRLTPERTFFIDDRAENIEAARAHGIRTHHFHAPDALETDLRRRGIWT